jgi:hypothetical protein
MDLHKNELENDIYELLAAKAFDQAKEDLRQQLMSPTVPAELGDAFEDVQYAAIG